MPYKSNTRTLLKVRDSQNELTEIQKNLSGVEIKVDAADKSIKDEVWKNTFIETTDSDGNVVKKRLEDLLIQNSISLQGINQSVSSYVTDLLNHEFTEYDEAVRNHVANAIKDTVTNYITGESSYINQKADQIKSVVGKSAFETVKVRYIRDWLFSNDKDKQNRFTECKVLTASGVNAAGGLVPKAFKSDLTEITSVDNLNYYTDGIVDASYIYREDLSMLQLDLGEVNEDIDTIQLYHYYADGRKCRSKLEISSDGTNWISVYDSDIDGTYTETAEGYMHTIQNQALADQISFLKQTLKTISLTVRENSSNFSSIVQDMKSIKQTVEQNKGDMETVVQQITDVDEGWKVSMKRIGASTDPNAPAKETCLMLNEEGVFVSSSTKEGQKVKITAEAFEGIYNEGLSDSKDITVFSLDKDAVYTNRLIAEKGADLKTMKLIPVQYSGFGGLAIIKSGGEA